MFFVFKLEKWFDSGLTTKMGFRWTPKRHKYCMERATNDLPRYVVYKQIFETNNDDSARVKSYELEKLPEIQEEIKKHIEEGQTVKVLSRQEKRERIASTVRADKAAILRAFDPAVMALDDPHDAYLRSLVDSYQENKRYNKDGEHIGTTITVRLPGTVGLIEIDNKMAGHNEPEEVAVLNNGGVMVVPTGGATLDDWEKEAAQQQEDLKKNSEN